MATHTAQPLMERLRQMLRCSPPAKPRWEQSKRRCRLHRPRPPRACVAVPTRCLLLQRMALLRQERVGASHTAQPVMDRPPLAAADLLGMLRLLAARREVAAAMVVAGLLLRLPRLRQIPWTTQTTQVSTRPTSAAALGTFWSIGIVAGSSHPTCIMRPHQLGISMSTRCSKGT